MPLRAFPRAVWAALAVFAWATPLALADVPGATLTVHADRLGARITPTEFGVFFEDINLGADGGLYSELVKNRTFEFPDPLMGWSKVAAGDARGTVAIGVDNPASTTNPHYLTLKVDDPGRGFGVTNEGFRGMGVRAGEGYRFSVKARGTAARLRVALVAPDGHVLAAAILDAFNGSWKTHAVTLRPDRTEAKARLELLLESGSLALDAVSLVPEATWKGRHPGLRSDLVQLLADLKPGFMRFPGGCIVEGKRLDTRYQWKATIGPPDDRRPIVNRWNDEFKHRPAPDYFQSFGLGFFEFFQLCDDLGAEPLPILNCGMACQFNSSELASLAETDTYIEDALDLIEFANGPESSPWGARRAALGHPRPFHLTMIGVGNEQWGPAYFERYERFRRVLKARHPEIRLVSSAGPSPADERFDLAWKRLRAIGADIVDEHSYARPDWFYDAAVRYDHYDRRGPKVFMGEYAAQSDKVVSVNNRNNWECALAEAAFLTGLERNADVVVMSSYAPLFAHAEGWQWTPDLIWFDNLRSFGTPSYHVQALFSRNRGDIVLPIELADPAVPAGRTPRLFASATRQAATGSILLKVVNASADGVSVTLDTKGPHALATTATALVLTGKLADENSFDRPRNVAPAQKKVSGVATSFTHAFPAHSLTVLRLDPAK